MCTTRQTALRYILLTFFLLSMVGCIRKNEKAIADDDASISVPVSRELATKLSGIWYRGPSKSINDYETREFSWGKEVFDYYRCLYIDLLAAQPAIGYAEQHCIVNTMVATVSGDAIEMVLSLPNGSPAATLLIKLPVPNLNLISLYRQDKSNLLWHEELTGSYYKLDGPKP
jgi:hypothetical protein